VFVGTVVRPYALSEPACSATLSHEFNMLEPEDSMKWRGVRATPERFNVSEADEIVRFAIAHGMKVRAHCLVWDHTHPNWLTDGQFTPDQPSLLLREPMATEMRHYAGQVFAWDVVNEARGNPRDSIRYSKPGIGLSDKGTAYVEQAFSLCA